MDNTEQTIFDEELREKEIKRLTSPLTYKKGRLSTKAYISKEMKFQEMSARTMNLSLSLSKVF